MPREFSNEFTGEQLKNYEKIIDRTDRHSCKNLEERIQYFDEYITSVINYSHSYKQTSLI